MDVPTMRQLDADHYHQSMPIYQKGNSVSAVGHAYSQDLYPLTFTTIDQLKG